MATIYVAKSVTDYSSLASFDTNTIVHAEGNQTVDTGLDQSGLAAGIANMYLLPTFYGNIGSGSAGALKCNITGEFINRAGGGEVHITPDGTAAEVIAKYIHNSNGRTFIRGSTGTVTVLEQSGGDVYVDDQVAVTNFYKTAGSTNILYKSTAITLANINGGTTTCGRGVTTLNVTGGATVLIKRIDTSSTLPAATTVTVTGRGTRLVWCGDTVTTFNVWGGATLDLSMAPKAFTTTINIDLPSDLVSKLASQAATLTTTINRFGGNKNWADASGPSAPL